MKAFKSFVIFAAALAAASTAFGWGQGHLTVARATLRVLPGAWGERLRTDEASKLFLMACEEPDRSKPIRERAEFLDEEIRAALDGNGKTSTYVFHGARERCELICALARAMKRDDLRRAAYLLGCFNHSAADTASANHSPLIQLVTYNWYALGLKGGVQTDCAALDGSPAGRRILTDAVDAVDRTPPDAAPSAVFAACYADEVRGTSFYRYDIDIVEGGEPALKAFAAEAAYAVRRTIEALLAAEAFSKLPEVPAFDVRAVSALAKKASHEFLAKRPIGDDALTRGLVPAAGETPEIGVIYDPTGFWTGGIVYMANRSFAAQVCTTLRKSHKAGLLDIRSVMRDGVPAGVRTVVFPATGFNPGMTTRGFPSADVVKALAEYVKRGGRLVWIGGRPVPPDAIFPESRKFAKNPVPGKWAHMIGPEATDRMPGARLVLPDGRDFTCRRPPKGGAGWYWGQFNLAFIPPQTLPEGGRETLTYVSKDGQRTLVGYTVGNRAYLPAFALYPYVFTDEKPCCRPLKLELDAAGAAILESVL